MEQLPEILAPTQRSSPHSLWTSLIPIRKSRTASSSSTIWTFRSWGINRSFAPCDRQAHAGGLRFAVLAAAGDRALDADDLFSAGEKIIRRTQLLDPLDRRGTGRARCFRGLPPRSLSYHRGGSRLNHGREVQSWPRRRTWSGSIASPAVETGLTCLCWRARAARWPFWSRRRDPTVRRESSTESAAPRRGPDGRGAGTHQ